VEKLVIPYVEKIFTSIIKPFFDSYFPPILCDSPKELAKLFSDLPFSNVDSNVIIKQCRTSTSYKPRQDLIAEFEIFRLKMIPYTPSLIAPIQWAHLTTIEQCEHYKGQLFKKRALYNTQQEGYNKRAKIDLANTKSTTVTSEDFDGEDWDLHTIYEKINNLMENPNFDKKSRLSKLKFKPASLRKEFYAYIKKFNFTKANHSTHTRIISLNNNLEKHFKDNENWGFL